MSVSAASADLRAKADPVALEDPDEYSTEDFRWPVAEFRGSVSDQPGLEPMVHGLATLT